MVDSEKELKKVKDIWLAPDLDEEDYQDNLQKITEWEEGLRTSEAFVVWQENDVSVQITKEARDLYINLSLDLINNRALTEEKRLAIHAKRDAAVWIISMINRNAAEVIDSIQNEIKTALLKHMS
jgi:hypothetical protein